MGTTVDANTDLVYFRSAGEGGSGKPCTSRLASPGRSSPVTVSNPRYSKCTSGGLYPDSSTERRSLDASDLRYLVSPSCSEVSATKPVDSIMEGSIDGFSLVAVIIRSAFPFGDHPYPVIWPDLS